MTTAAASEEVCPYCGYATSQLHLLFDHVDRHHLVVDERESHRAHCAA